MNMTIATPKNIVMTMMKMATMTATKTMAAQYQ